MSWPLPVREDRASSTGRCRGWLWLRSWTRSSRNRCAPSDLPVVGKQALPSNGELDQEIVFAALEPYLVRRAPAGGGALCRRRCRWRRRRSPRQACRCARRCSAPAVRIAPCSRCCGSTRWPPRRHRLLHARRLAAAAGPRQLPVHGRQSVGMMAGMNKVLGRKAAVAVLGDSTFFHSGVTPLIDARYNETRPGRGARQSHHGDDRPSGAPGIGRAPRSLARARARHRAALQGHRRALPHRRCARRAGRRGGARGELPRRAWACWSRGRRAPSKDRAARETVIVDDERCNLCGLCLDIGCPALGPARHGRVGDACTGCGVCASRSAAAAL